MPTDDAPSRIGRRELVQGGAVATAAAGLGGCFAQTVEASRSEGGLIGRGDVVLFQGDSITDASRDRDREVPNEQASLGTGYAWLAAAGLLVRRPEDELRIHNRGISGDKVFQLADRWDEDCLDLAPDVLSVLIGVNDVWHARDGDYDGTLEVYERDYDALLARTRAALPEVRLVVCEPFVLSCGAVDESWLPDFAGYRAAARRVAERHGAIWVGFQAMFDEAVRHAPPEHWAADGVHPSPTGAALMAQTWLDTVAWRRRR